MPYHNGRNGRNGMNGRNGNRQTRSRTNGTHGHRMNGTINRQPPRPQSRRRMPGMQSNPLNGTPYDTRSGGIGGLCCFLTGGGMGTCGDSLCSTDCFKCSDAGDHSMPVLGKQFAPGGFGSINIGGNGGGNGASRPNPAIPVPTPSPIPPRPRPVRNSRGQLLLNRGAQIGVQYGPIPMTGRYWYIDENNDLHLAPNSAPTTPDEWEHIIKHMYM